MTLYVYSLWLNLGLPSSPHISSITLVNDAKLFTININKFKDRIFEKLLLLPEEALHAGNVKPVSAAKRFGLGQGLSFSLLLQLGTETPFHDLQPILGVVSVQLGQVADGAGARQNNLVTDEGGAWPLGGYHADSFTTSECFQRLMFKVSALHDYCGALFESKSAVSSRSHVGGKNRVFHIPWMDL